MKKILILLFVFVSLCSTIFAQTSRNAFRMEKQASEADYQKYVGKRIRFRKALGTLEREFNIKADTSVDYTITSITVKPHKDIETHIVFSPISGGKSLKVIAYSDNTGYRKKACFVDQIPLIFMDEYESVKDKNVGVTFVLPEDRQEYKILEMGFGSIKDWKYLMARSDYKVVNVKKGNIMYFSAPYIERVLSGELTQSSQADKLLDGAAFSQEFSLFKELESKNTETWLSRIREKKYIDNDRNIFYQYVIPINDTTEIRSIVTYAEQWLGDNNKFRFITQHADFSKDNLPTIKGTVKLNFRSSHLYFVTTDFRKIYENIHNYADVIVEIKSNRIRITVSASEYDITYSGEGLTYLPTDLQDKFKNYKTPMILHAPYFKEKPEEFWNEAYIKTNACCISIINDLIKYINDTHDELLKRKQKEEVRQNEDW